MGNPVLICVLIGLPGSGKSWFARNVVVNPFRKVVFSYDDIPLKEDNYKVYRRKVRDRLEILIQDELETPEPTVVIVDDIMILRSMRYEIFSMAGKKCAGFCQVYFKTDVETCVLRNSERGSSTDVTEEMIRDQHRRLEAPRLSGSVMDQHVMVVEDNRYDPDHVLWLLNEISQQKLSLLPDKKLHQPTDQSIVHKIDLILRKHISSCVADIESPEAKKVLAKEYNSRRKELLQDIRVKNLIFDEPFLDVTCYM